MTVDDELVVIGTCNWDIRSLILHDEVVSVFYDASITAATRPVPARHRRLRRGHPADLDARAR